MGKPTYTQGQHIKASSKIQTKAIFLQVNSANHSSTLQPTPIHQDFDMSVLWSLWWSYVLSVLSDNFVPLKVKQRSTVFIRITIFIPDRALFWELYPWVQNRIRKSLWAAWCKMRVWNDSSGDGNNDGIAKGMGCFVRRLKLFFPWWIGDFK